jgi:hypothetical protein
MAHILINHQAERDCHMIPRPTKDRRNVSRVGTEPPPFVAFSVNSRPGASIVMLAALAAVFAGQHFPITLVPK